MKTETKHTPGPWTAHGIGGTDDGGSIVQHPCFKGDVIAANGQAIARSHCYLSIQGNTPEEAEANAHLIAAAPELLSALREVLLEVDSLLHRRRSVIRADEMDTLPRALNLAHAAISRAEGVAP